MEIIKELTKGVEKVKSTIGASKFTKEALVKSKRFANDKDAIETLLKDTDTVTIEEMEKKLKDFYSKEVK